MGSITQGNVELFKIWIGYTIYFRGFKIFVLPFSGALGASGLSRIISSGGLSTGTLGTTSMVQTLQPAPPPTAPALSASAAVVATSTSASTSVSGISTLPSSLPTPGVAQVNPLKRKLEDDDYDI